ncbi:MAG: NADP-dependent oxidoreductase [Bacteroidota bacterium]
MKNTAITLANRPSGIVEASNFNVEEHTVPELEDGQLLIQIEYISLDPAMRGWMNKGTTYIKGVEIGAVMRGFAAGKVIQSKNIAYQEGDYVTGMLGVQTYVISDGKGLTKVDIKAGRLSLHIGVLGMPGMTAYFGLLKKGQPKAGETVFISGAAGIVGSTVGQIAKIKGCKVIGTAGSDKKCDYLINDCNFDAAINYKTQNIDKELKKHAPSGVDIFYDNVGGEILDIALANLARGARVVICGAISQYNKPKIQGPSNYMKIVTARGYINGIIVFDYIDQYPEGVKDIGTWLSEGKMQSKEHIIEGIENFPDTLKMLFTGDNFGKLLLKI